MNASFSTGTTSLGFVALNPTAPYASATLTKSGTYDGRDNPEIRIVGVFICKLRKKLAEASKDINWQDGKMYIETVWDCGHRLYDPHQVRAYVPYLDRRSPWYAATSAAQAAE